MRPNDTDNNNNNNKQSINLNDKPDGTTGTGNNKKTGQQ